MLALISWHLGLKDSRSSSIWRRCRGPAALRRSPPPRSASGTEWPRRCSGGRAGRRPWTSPSVETGTKRKASNYHTRCWWSFAFCTYPWEVSISTASRSEASVGVDALATLVLLPGAVETKSVGKMYKSQQTGNQRFGSRHDSLRCHNTVLSTLTASFSAGPAEQPAVKFYRPFTSRLPDRKKTRCW